jgi:hypothetical protein
MYGSRQPIVEVRMMKSALFFATGVLALAAAPALADNGQVFDVNAHAQAYGSSYPSKAARQCFNGKFIAGANRAGDKTLYVQAATGAVYRLELSGGCAALDAADKLTMRANGADAICAGATAEMVARTPAGAKRCSVSEVRPVTSGELSALATGARR